MAILDWFKEIPLSAVLKEKLTDLEKEISSLKTKVSNLEAENTLLKTKLEDSEKKRRTLEEQITEEHNNPLTFDDKTGTWVSASHGLRYCAKCKSNNLSSPLKNESHGWRCSTCNTFYPDPSRSRQSTQEWTPSDPSVGY